MSLRDWLSQRDKQAAKKAPAVKRTVPDGIWEKCPGCSETIYVKEITKNLRTCPKCAYHFPMPAPERIGMLVDQDSFVEINAGVGSVDPLGFTAAKAYSETLAGAIKKTGLEEAVVTGTATMAGRKIALGVMDFRFIGGSMGSAVGEKVTRLIETAEAERLPLLIVAASGGARMQEGILSLMQMAKTTAAIEKYYDTGCPYISVLTDPTGGGVTASFATLADIIIAEPGAWIGFTGPRVIENTIRQKLPRGFQTAEFMLEHGMIDMIVKRSEHKSKLCLLLDYLAGAA